ncbi:MAG: P-II family nitrogen regulator [Sideroxydans sp.]|nr:P-II family nitrogen regulator [Sideroxydans sp.]
MTEVHTQEDADMEKDCEFCNVTAIIRGDALEKVEQQLHGIGVNGISVMRVKGYGEYANFYSPEGLTSHVRVEIFTAARAAETIAQTIMDAACSGVPGDGIVAVQPVDKVYRIRLRAAVEPDAL